MGFRGRQFAFVLVLSLFAMNGPASGEQAQTSLATPVKPLAVQRFQLLTSTTAWASTGNQLLLTRDGGQHWRDISPPKWHNPVDASLLKDHYADVFFLDPETGWVLIPFSNDFEDWSFRLSFTKDGGKTWLSGSIPEWKYDRSNGERGLADQGRIAFSDKDHGWLSLGIQGHATFAASALYVTSDGGRTWHEPAICEDRSNTGPEGRVEGIYTRSAKDAWMLAGSGEGSSLYVTRDGGACFREISPTAPAEISPAEYPTYSLPTFADEEHGFEAVSYRGPIGTKSSAVLFETADGGQTWRPDRVISNLAEGERVGNIVAGNTWIVPQSPEDDEPGISKIEQGQRLYAKDHKHTGTMAHCSLSFVSSEVGWTNCGGALYSTHDGGASWKLVTPRARGGVLTKDPVSETQSAPLRLKSLRGVRSVLAERRAIARSSSDPASPMGGPEQHLGFDKDYVISTDDMAVWWQYSPFYDVGIYLPGSASGPHSGNPKNGGPPLDVDWVSAVASQGWGLLPIWSGPQAPCACKHDKNNPVKTYPGCTPYPHTFSSDPTQANIDGQNEATSAEASASALGLAGTIIYVDIEDYSHSACGIAVQSYVNGWVSGMHQQSISAGVYAGIFAAPDTSSADDGYIPRDDHRVTVWGLNHGHENSSPLTDSYAWTSRQRIHQYIENNWEIWGGTQQYRIDEDLIDGAAIPSSGTKLYTLQSPELDGPAGYVGIADQMNTASNPLPLGTVLGYNGGQNVYTVSSTDGLTLISSLAQTWPTAINNVGQIAGYNNSGGYIYTPGSDTVAAILGPDGEWANPLSLNDAGWVFALYADENGISHCMLAKPPYTSPVAFDGVGYASCLNQTTFGENDSVLLSAQLNGIGQIAASTETGPDIDDPSVEWSTVLIDDVESASPTPSDGVSVIATTSPGGTTETTQFLVSAGLNNNGQIAGSVDDGVLFTSFPGTQGFLINTDGVVSAFPLFGTDFDYIEGLNDDVQFAGTTSSNGGVGFTIDSPH